MLTLLRSFVVLQADDFFGNAKNGLINMMLQQRQEFPLQDDKTCFQNASAMTANNITRDRSTHENVAFLPCSSKLDGRPPSFQKGKRPKGPTAEAAAARSARNTTDQVHGLAALQPENSIMSQAAQSDSRAHRNRLP